MFDGLWARYQDTMARLRRLERRELREARRWLEHTSNLVHVSILIFVPLVIGLVTYLANTLAAVSFLLFPPLASGTYTLFADPESEYAEPTTFVGGMTLGAFSGWPPSNSPPGSGTTFPRASSRSTRAPRHWASC